MTVSLLWVTLAAGVAAQRFQDGVEYEKNPALTAKCKQAVNSLLACDSLITYRPDELASPSKSELDRICTSECQGSLKDYRATVDRECSAKTDVVVIDDIAYPATYTADQLLYNYRRICDTKRNTDQYCLIAVNSIANGSSELGPKQMCSDCILERYKVDLSSPFGYSHELAKQFSSLTSSCSASGYSYTSPTPIAINATKPPVPSPVTCKASERYTIQEGDDCKSISMAHNVSTWSLTQTNQLPSYCKDFPGPGTKLCLPKQCHIYTVKEGDTCDGLVKANSGQFTVTQLRSWNPFLNQICRNLFQWTGYQICISPPGGELDPPVSSITRTPITTCGGPWQPSSCYTPIPTSDLWPDSDNPIPLPLAEGTLHNCAEYAEYQNTTKPRYDNSCNAVAYFYGVTVEDLQQWNPSLSDEVEACGIQPGFSYCVIRRDKPPPETSTRSSTTTTTSTRTSATTTTSTTTSPSDPTPSPVQEGIAKKCSKYYFVKKDDGCFDIADKYEITLKKFYKWNPAVKDDCSGLWPDYYVCVGILS